MARVAPMESKSRFLLPLSIVFFAFGVEICDYFETCRFSRFLRFVRILNILVLHCTMVPILVFNYFHLQQPKDQDYGSFLAVYIADLLLVFISMITYEFYLIRQKQIRQFLKNLLDLAQASMQKRQLLVRVMVLACCVLPFTSAPLCIITSRKNKNLAGHSSGNDTHDFQPFFWEQQHSMWHYLWLTTFRPFALLSCALFLFICFMFVFCFWDLEDLEGLPSVSRFLQRHQVLCSHLSRAEALFSLISFVACSSDVVTTTFFLRSLNLGGPPSTWKCSLLLSVIMNFGLFASRILAAAAVNSQVTASLQGMDRMVNPLLSSSTTNSFMILTKLTCYIQRLSINPPTLTGGGFFTMTRSCILAVGSAILTYILVLYQSL